MTQPQAALQLREVSVSFEGRAQQSPVHAVQRVSLDVLPGKTLALLGPSGCGKSTLLRAIAGLEPLSHGAITWQGEDLSATPTHRRGFALMFQDSQLFEHMTVASNVSYAPRVRPRGQRTTAAARAAQVAELLELVGLPGYGERMPHELSGGQQQRVALARALAAQPRLLLLDEPFSALDRSLREHLTFEVRSILRHTETTALFVTHDQDEAATIADDVAVMLDGEIAQMATAAGLWHAPVSAGVARFIGYSSVVDAAAARTLGLEAAVTEMTQQQGLALRPSALKVCDAPGLPARVISAVARREVISLRVEVAGIAEPLAALAARSEPTPEPGALVHLCVAPSETAVVQLN